MYSDVTLELTCTCLRDLKKFQYVKWSFILSRLLAVKVYVKHRSNAKWFIYRCAWAGRSTSTRKNPPYPLNGKLGWSVCRSRGYGEENNPFFNWNPIPSRQHRTFSAGVQIRRVIEIINCYSMNSANKHWKAAIMIRKFHLYFLNTH